MIATLAFAVLIAPHPGESAAPFVEGSADVRRVGAPTTSASGCVIDASGATVTRADGGVETIPLEDLISVEFARRPLLATAAGERMVALLHDGSRVEGAIAGGSADALRIALRPGVELEIPIDSLSALFLGARAARLERSRFEVSAKEDALFKRPESGGDFTRGTLQAFSANGCEFEYSLGSGKFAWSELEAVVLAHQSELDPLKAPVVHADLVPDGSLTGTLVRWGDAGLELRPQGFPKSVTLPPELLRALRFDGARHVWLSDRAPSRVEQTPYLGSGDQFLFPWRADRTVTGRPLAVGGRSFAKGFGCHSRTRLEFAVTPPDAQFEAWVGVADEVLELADRGAIQFAVALDGKEVWRSAVLRAGEPAVRVGPIALAGAKTLALVTDFGDGEDVADRGVWGEALLLR
jgi:hypothetical protein